MNGVSLKRAPVSRQGSLSRLWKYLKRSGGVPPRTYAENFNLAQSTRKSPTLLNFGVARSHTCWKQWSTLKVCPRRPTPGQIARPSPSLTTWTVNNAPDPVIELSRDIGVDCWASLPEFAGQLPWRTRGALAHCRAALQKYRAARVSPSYWNFFRNACLRS